MNAVWLGLCPLRNARKTTSPSASQSALASAIDISTTDPSGSLTLIESIFGLCDLAMFVG